ncbi:MAG: dynamin family protein, partial [Gemmatimonadaceae bacterium]
MTSQSNGVATATEALPSAPLARIAAVADLLDEPRVQDDAQQLSARLEEGRFHVACIGQFKRGKSTLLDALVGRAVLPTDVVPVTAVPTVVRHGPQWCARVRLADGEWHDVSLD